MPRIHANGVELYYEFHGSESAPVLVLNNGILMNAATSWAFQTRELSTHYRICNTTAAGRDSPITRLLRTRWSRTPTI